MSKIIKFRAWDLNLKRMLQDVQTGTAVIYATDGGISISTDCALMQFTGFYDRNGVEIFEGDILNTKTTFENNMADRRFQKRTEIIVGYKDGCFIDINTDCILINKIKSIETNNIDFEIMGNIYQNPELLK